ncbi:MAG TPA: ribosome silencing factor [Firmicutes bacterium]|nr:ribosome silencing factor [Bacillota bacterium]
MTSLELTKQIVKILDTKKAEDIRVIKIKDISIIADYFIIATGNSSTQVKALADEVDFKIGEMGLSPAHTEGYQSATWTVLDYLDVVVHVFYKDTRTTYSLERLWSDGVEIPLDELLQ